MHLRHVSLSRGMGAERDGGPARLHQQQQGEISLLCATQEMLMEAGMSRISSDGVNL